MQTLYFMNLIVSWLSLSKQWLLCRISVYQIYFPSEHFPTSLVHGQDELRRVNLILWEIRGQTKFYTQLNICPTFFNWKIPSLIIKWWILWGTFNSGNDYFPYRLRFPWPGLNGSDSFDVREKPSRTPIKSLIGPRIVSCSNDHRLGLKFSEVVDELISKLGDH